MKTQHRNRIYLALSSLAIVLQPSLCHAQTLKGEAEATEARRVQTPSDDEKKRNLIEFYGNREAITDGNGNWDSGGMRYTRIGDGYSAYFELNGYNRKKGDGGAEQIVGGLYKDWTERLYTYTSLSKGTNVDYLPKFRADHDFNYKFDEEKKWVWTLGATYIDYYTPNSDTIYSTGFTHYGDGLILSYRYFHNISNPGSLKSHSQSVSADQGYWYKYLNTIIYSWGNQAYMATYLDSPESVQRTSKSILLRHRHWVRDDWGFWLQAGAVRVDGAYDGKSGGAGLFFYF